MGTRVHLKFHMNSTESKVNDMLSSRREYVFAATDEACCAVCQVRAGCTGVDRDPANKQANPDPNIFLVPFKARKMEHISLFEKLFRIQ